MKANNFTRSTICVLARYSFYAMIFISLNSCHNESIVPTAYHIDENFAIYVESFFLEAEKRGIEVERKNLIVEFGTTSFEICAECIHPTGHGQRKISINYCWEDALSENREALIFHELGHCLLNREHKNDLLPNGAPASIMNRNIDAPYGPCVYVIDGDLSCNKTARRSYYIDELFDPDTGVPEWGE